jgi:predicted DNA-binding protein YlxM (UPF0122 family)
MLEKTERINLLYDFYGTLLTDRQQQMIELYFLDDLSLSEIAEQFSISRQAVHDNLRRATQQLEEWEDKLQLLKVHEQKQQQIRNILAELKPFADTHDSIRQVYRQIAALLDD